MHERADNFFQQYNKPFGVENLMMFCCISRAEADYALAEAMAAGRVFEPIPGIFVVRDTTAICHTTESGSGTWRYSYDSAVEVLNCVKAGARSARLVGQKMGVSRTWAHKYLEALASIGAIEALCVGYRVLRDDNLSEIGTRIEKGILTRQRKEHKYNGGNP